MICSTINPFLKVALATVFAVSAVNVHAMESTAGGRDSDSKQLEVSTQMEMHTIKAIVEAAINTISARVGLLEGRVTGLEVTAANLDSRLTTAESDIVTLKAQVLALQATDANLQAQINALTVRMVNAEANINSLWAYYYALKAQADTSTAQVADLYARVNSLQTQHDALSARISSLEGGRGNWDWMFSAWRPWVEGQLAAKVVKGATITYSSCYEASGWYGQHVTCSGNYVVTKVCSSGRDPDCGGTYTRITCCSLTVN